jgi:hypothetical protein
LAVSVTLPPVQKEVGPLGVIVAAVTGVTVTMIGVEVYEQPEAFVATTLYEPLAVTEIDDDVWPLLQR